MFLKNLKHLNLIKIPKWIKATSTNITFHGFNNTSENTYAVVRYVQFDANSNLKILGAKSKITSLKSVSIPHLELNSAWLLARLFSSVFAVLTEHSITFHV